MKIFILGKSLNGKTPLCDLLESNIISASGWIKEKDSIYNFSQILDKEEYIKYISEISVKELNIDDMQPYNYMMSKLKNGVNIIEGIRNIKDFILLHSPTDKVVFIKNTNKKQIEQSLDSGVDILKSYCEWLVGVGLKNKSDVLFLEYSGRLTKDLIDKIKYLENV